MELGNLLGNESMKHSSVLYLVLRLSSSPRKWEHEAQLSAVFGTETLFLS